MDKKLLEILACPLCNGILKYEKNPLEELICKHCAVAFPVKDGIPVMLEDDARTLTINERLSKKS